MLVDHADAGPDGIGRRMEGMRLAVDDDLAFVRLVQAVELAHQRALAGAILAQQGVHLAGVHVEANLGIGQHAREALDDVAHLDVLDAVVLGMLSWRWHDHLL